MFVRGDWIQDDGNQDVATRLLEACFEGWIWCSDNLQGLHEDRARQRADARPGPPDVAG